MTSLAVRSPVFSMTMTTEFGSRSANVLLLDCVLSISNSSEIRADSIVISTSCEVPSSLVTRTVMRTSPLSKEASEETLKAKSRMLSLAMVVTPFIGATVQPSGRLSRTSYVNESSPFPLLLMVNPAVVDPPGDTPTVSVTSVVLNAKNCGTSTLIETSVISPVSAMNRTFKLCPSSRCHASSTDVALALTSPMPSARSIESTQSVPL